MAKISGTAAVKMAKAAEKQQLAVIAQAAKAAVAGKGTPTLGAVTIDSFVNFQHKMGMGADNILSSSMYGFNPLTRNRIQLEWMYRGSWLAGVAVDVKADDMTRCGVNFKSELTPEQSEMLDSTATSLQLWSKVADTVKWGRLYGGAIGVVLIDGQNMKTPLRIDSVGPEQYKGIIALDRWMVEPSLNDLITDFGPNLGLPKYYTVNASAPALRGQVIHHSRVAFRILGIPLPYQQAMIEMLWGISVLERMQDRMVAFDLASTGMAQLINKAFLRMFKVKGLKQIVAAGGKALDGISAYADNARRYQGIEGVTMIDGEDEFETQTHSAMSGMSEALMQIGQQLSGALQVPLTRLFGQSPSGLNANGDNDMQIYYDHINQLQMQDLHAGITLSYKLIAKSKGIKLPKDFAVEFKSLWEMDAKQKADIAKVVSDAIIAAYGDGLIDRQTALRELRQLGRTTGIYTNITTEQIEAADDEVQPPDALETMKLDHQSSENDKDRQVAQQAAEATAKVAASAKASAEPGRKKVNEPELKKRPITTTKDSDSDEHWITVHGRHVKVNKEGTIVEGGKGMNLQGKMKAPKKTEPDPEYIKHNAASRDPAKYSTQELKAAYHHHHSIENKSGENETARYTAKHRGLNIHEELTKRGEVHSDGSVKK